MSTKQLHVELVETATKIRSMQETLKALRIQHTAQKARLTEARLAKQAEKHSK
jgi:hypothetical protein